MGKIGDSAKRIFDFTLTLAGTICISPLLGYIAYRIKKEDPGPVIFRHMRVGKDGRVFPCYKFRSMVVNSQEMLQKYLAENPAAREEWEREFKLKNDPRVTPIGKLLRRTSLDELPQIFNVLKGEMSLVGPRPVIQEELDKYYGDAAKLYCSVKPGITGLWQVSGRSDLDYAQRVALDEKYIKTRTLKGDIIILCKTLLVVWTGGEHTNSHRRQNFKLNLQLHTAKRSNVVSDALKRLLDFFLAICGVIVLSPLFIIIICKIKKDDPGSAIFIHVRAGKKYKEYPCYKFRSMKIGAEQMLKKYLAENPEAALEYSIFLKLKNDPRVTTFGRILRATSMDELPQLFNVIKGEMSLVGPRPYLLQELLDMGETKSKIITSVKPGITGYWQVHGRNETSYEERVEMDCWYVQNHSLWMDIKILFKTVKVVFSKKGAY